MHNNSKDNRTKMKTSNLWVKILVPVIIVIIVAGIFIFKNAPSFDKDDKAEQTNTDPIAVQTEDAGSLHDADDIDYNSAEFALDATDNFDLNKLLSYGLPVIIDFGSDTCISCIEMSPVLEELNEELRGKAIVKFVNVAVNSDVLQTMPMRGIPTQFFFDKDGRPYVPEVLSPRFIMYEHKETGEHVFTSHPGPMTKNEILAVLKELGVE